MIPPLAELAKALERAVGNPLGAREDVCSRWASGLGLRRGGPVVLYTGCLYQLMAYASSLVKIYARLGPLAGPVVSAGKRFPRILGVASRILVRGDPEVEAYAERALRSVVEILRRSGVDFGYLYEGDVYSGVYLYELGLEDLFAERARRVHRILVREGVRRIITVDPHTTYVMREVYPRYVEGFALDVVHYLELVGSTPKRGRGRVVIHDSCYMARRLGLLGAVRRSMKGIEYVEPKNSGASTLCCGGPVEGIYPDLALRISVRRALELASAGGERAAVMCPICFVNLRRGFRAAGKDMPVSDLAEEILSAL